MSNHAWIEIRKPPFAQPAQRDGLAAFKGAPCCPGFSTLVILWVIGHCRHPHAAWRGCSELHRFVTQHRWRTGRRTTSMFPWTNKRIRRERVSHFRCHPKPAGGDLQTDTWVSNQSFPYRYTNEHSIAVNALEQGCRVLISRHRPWSGNELPTVRSFDAPTGRRI